MQEVAATEDERARVKADQQALSGLFGNASEKPLKRKLEDAAFTCEDRKPGFSFGFSFGDSAI